MKKTNFFIKGFKTLTAVVLVFIIALSTSISAFAAQVFDSLTSDLAVVTEVSFGNISTGTAPFDADNAAGNDSSADNKIVRTFDSVVFDFNVVTESYTNDGFRDARVKLEFVLPLSSAQAEFDVAAMAWMDETEGYKHSITTQTRNVGGQNKECQVLTCYKHLIPSTGNLTVVPGRFTENLTIKVLNCANGTQFPVLISAALEHGEWEGECQEHSRVEKLSATSDKITVTAKPKYNIKINGAQQYKDVFDFNTGKTTAVNYGIGKKVGRSITYGLILQLYNDNASKGMKGIELPNGDDITFDVVFTSKFTPDQTATPVDVTSTYTPLAFTCHGTNNPGEPSEDGRVIAETNGSDNVSPLNVSNGGNTSCFNGGKWTAVQEGNVVHFTVSDYELNLKHLPQYNRVSAGAPIYGEKLGIGCFSSGELWVVQPFNKENDIENVYDIKDDYGSGAFSIEANIQNMKIKSVGEQLVADSAGTNDSQMVQNDDRKATTLALYYPGIYQNRVHYTHQYNDDVLPQGLDWKQTTYRNGEDIASTGETIALAGGFSYNRNSEDSNDFRYGTTLLKFYAEAMEPTEELLIGEDVKKYNIGVERYFATKKNGTDWIDDQEQKTTYEDDMVFYKNLADIPSGHLCTGILYIYTGVSEALRGDVFFMAAVKAKIREDEKLVSKAFPMVSTSRLWSQKHLDEAGVKFENLPDITDGTTKIADFPNHYKSANIGTSGYYTRETYASDGSGALGTHNSDWAFYGDTVLIIDYKPQITKNLAQKVGSDEKTVFNLDAGQRIVDFVIDSQVQYSRDNVNAQKRIAVAVVDVLPEHLYYKAGSSYKGGTYTQTSEEGGTQGIITGGESFEPIVTLNADGTQKLTWIFEDVLVGTVLPSIHYSCEIGTLANAATDVPVGSTAIMSYATIHADGEYSTPTVANRKRAETGITVTKGTANSFGKYANSEYIAADGEAKYVVYFNNNASVEEKDVVLVDTMPFDDVAQSNFEGDYKITKWKLDKNLCDVSKIKLYYIEDESFKDITAKDLTAADIEARWTAVQINAQGECSGLLGKRPVAWAVIGDVEAHRSIHVDMNVKLEPTSNFAGQNIYVNRVSYDQTVVAATVKTEKPALEKFIVENTQKVKASTAQINGKVDYLIETAVPHHEGFDKYFFIVNDKLSEGLTFNDDVSVKVGDKVLVKDTDFVVYEGDKAADYSFRIAFADIKAFTAGEKIEITYSATLNDKAQIGNKGNLNTASLTYSSDPESLEVYESADKGIPEEDVPVGLTEDSVVKTYTTEFKIIKTDKEGKALEGVEFKLTGKDFEAIAKTDANGEIVIIGLKEGEYTLKETKALEGYKAITPITFTLECALPQEVDALSECAWSVSSNSSAQIMAQEGKFESAIENEKLPEEKEPDNPKNENETPKEEQPQKPTPSTGDSSNVLWACYLAVLSLAGIVIIKKLKA